MGKLRLSKSTKEKQLKNLRKQAAEMKEQAMKKYLLPVCILLTVIGLFIAGIGIFRYQYGLGRLERDITDIENILTNNGDGISASDTPIEVTENVSVKPSVDYLNTEGGQMLDDWLKLQNLKLFTSHIDNKSLWSLYYTYSYNDYHENLSWMKGVANWYDQLNNDTETECTTTCNDPNCQFCKELDRILDADLEEILNSHAHQVYHAQLQQSIDSTELSEEDWYATYSAYIISEPSFIKSLTLKTVLVNNRLQKNETLSNFAYYGNKALVKGLFGGIVKTNTYTKQSDIEQILDIVDLTADEDTLDRQIIDVAPELLITYGNLGKAIDLGDTYVQKIEGTDDVEEWLKTKDELRYKNVLDIDKVLDIGCALLYWDVESIEHIEKLPTFEEMMNDEEWKNEMLYKIVENAFWNSVYSNDTNDETFEETGEE